MTDALTLTGPRRSHRRRGIVLVALVATVLAAPGIVYYVLTAEKSAPTGPEAVSAAVFEEVTGVRVVRIAIVGGGGIIDVRVQALDPDKAIAIHEEDGALALVDEETGEVLNTAFHGRHAGGTTQTGLDAAVVYYLLFANSGGALDRGDRVSLVLEDVRLEHVLVQ